MASILSLLIFLLPAASAGAAPAAGEAPLFRMTPGEPPTLRPWAEAVGDTQVVDGAIRGTTQAGWARSGLRVGPLPTPRGALVLEYDFRPVAFGLQSQELASDVPSTHWYMLFADGGGRWHLHTRHEGKWSRRLASEKAVRPGIWYRARILLKRTSIAGAIRERDSGETVWEFPETPMDDIGDETAFVLCDEGPDPGAGTTDWGALAVSTDDPALKARLDILAKERERERLAREKQREAAERLDREGIALLPMPQRVEMGKGRLALGKAPGLTAPADMRRAAEAVRLALRERAGIELGSGAGASATVTLALLPKGLLTDPQARQGYRLTVDARGVRLEARTSEGFFYGAQTLAQLLRPDGTLPHVAITDWPAIESRLVMVAVSQGAFQVIDLEYWKRMIRELSAVKINRIMPYFEGGTFYYEKYPFLGVKGKDGFTREKAQELSRYARERFIRLVPQQEALGHSSNVLCHEELKGLRESGGVFCSSRPEVFAFLGDVFDELAAAFPDSDYIHVGGDEFAHGFAQCPECKARAEAVGKPGLYAEHLAKLQELLKARKRKMMIWWHEEGYTEEAADKLSKEMVIFDWHYGNQASYPSLERLQKLGFKETWATPAVTRYYDGSRNDFENTLGNIGGFLKAGARAGVPGACTCTWVHGIWGGRNLFELNYYALLYSGQCAWNPAWDDAADFRTRYARHWLGLSGDALEEEVRHAVHAPFGEAKEQKFWRDSRELEPILAAAPAKTAEEIAKRPELVAEAEALLKLCARAEEVLERWRREAKRNQATVEYLRHDVLIHVAAARRILAVAQAAELSRKAASLPAAERAAALAPAVTALREVVRDYERIEEGFRRSVREAGGGECGWGGWFPFVAKGGIQFRAKEGREAITKLASQLGKGEPVQWP